MEDIRERVLDIKEQLEFFDDELEKYEYIIDLGKKLEPLDKEYKKDEYLVQGCTSKVWLVSKEKDGKLILSADSEAMIVKGLVYIVISIFSNIQIEKIKQFDMNLLDELALSEIITPNRQSGVAGMIQKIKEYTKGL